MATTVHIQCDKQAKITKFNVKKGQKVSKGTILCLYECDGVSGVKLKSSQVGTIEEIVVKEGEILHPGCEVMKVGECSHSTVMKDMCADCGADLRRKHGLAGERKDQVSASVAMVHSIPELIISEEQARQLGKEDEERLLKTRKLVLLVDLDQTLIHTTNDNIPVNLKGVQHFQLWHGNMLLWYHTRLRPHTQEFLELVSKMYELHICTFGNRMYAHTIAKILDPEGKYFSHRILSRDECFNATSKQANLKALFPCGDSMVCIIDDREDVWSFVPNIIQVKPYHFFQGTADINAPPGLTKTEDDDKLVVHKVKTVPPHSSTKEVDQLVRTVQPGRIGKNCNSTGEDGGDANTAETKEDCCGQTVEEKTDVSGRNFDVEQTKNECVSTDFGSDIATTDRDHCLDSGSEFANKNSDIGNEYQDGKVDRSKIDSTGPKQIDRTEGEKTGSTSSVQKEDKSNKEIASNDNRTDQENTGSTVYTCGTEKSACEDDTKGGDEKVPDKTGSVTEENVVDENCSKQECSQADSSDKKEVEEIEWEDEDDYLLYLLDILTKVHKAFYDLHDQMIAKPKLQGEKPNVKSIIPYVRRKVLKGCSILFSGIIPTNMAPEKSRAYRVAKALGANVHTNLIPSTSKSGQDTTTHVVAAKLGTMKVKQAQKARGVKLVNLKWLWSCADRWERVDERLFPLTEDSPSPDLSKSDRGREKENKQSCKRKSDDDLQGECNKQRKFDPSQSTETDSEMNGLSKEAIVDEEINKVNREVDEGSESVSVPEKPQFSFTYNPLMAFSDDDIACMDKEVEDIMDEDEEDSSENEEDRDQRIRDQVLHQLDVSSSSEDSLSGESPHGWKTQKRRLSRPCSSDDERKSGSNDDEEKEMEGDSENELDKFEKTVEAFAPDTESDEDYEESIGSADEEIAEAVLKEFMS